MSDFNRIPRRGLLRASGFADVLGSIVCLIMFALSLVIAVLFSALSKASVDTPPAETDSVAEEIASNLTVGFVGATSTVLYILFAIACVIFAVFAAIWIFSAATAFGFTRWPLEKAKRRLPTLYCTGAFQLLVCALAIGVAVWEVTQEGFDKANTGSTLALFLVPAALFAWSGALKFVSSAAIRKAELIPDEEAVYPSEHFAPIPNYHDDFRN